jgi:hypothetical protein
MQKVRVPISNFQFGEISPSLSSRTDTGVYAASAERIENLFLRAEGGVVKRNGLKSVYDFSTIGVPTSYAIIQVTNYANIAVGDTVNIYDTNGDLYILRAEAAGSSAPSSPSGNVYFFRPYSSNNQTATNISVAIKLMPFIHNATPQVAFCYIQRKSSLLKNLEISVNSEGLSVYQNFSKRSEIKPHIKLFPFIFSHDERYIVSLIKQKFATNGRYALKIFRLNPDDDGNSPALSTTVTGEVKIDSETISTAAAVGLNANLVINGSLASSGSVTFADGYSRKVSITSSGDDSGISFTVTGVKNNDFSTSTETITGANAGTAYGSDLWKSITQITAVGDPAGTVSVGNHEIELPFNESYFDEYTFTQSGDVMFICHPLFMPRQLVRTGLDSFRVEPFLFDSQSDVQKIYQPYYSFQDQGVTLDPSATTGTNVILTTSSPYWDTTGSATGGDYLDSLHLGTTIKFHDTEIEITSVQSSTQAKGTVFGTLSQTLGLNAFRTTDSSTNVEVTHFNHGLFKDDSITISNAAGVGNISASNLNGVRTITSIIDSNRYTFTAGGSANTTIDGGGAPTIETHAASTKWSEQSFSALRGYPAAVTFHENRLVFAGTTSQPDSIWMSKSAQYYNFDVGDAEDNDSIQITANVGEVNEIRHLVSNRDLQIFTAASELYIPSFQNKPLTPTTVTIRKQTSFGSEYANPQIMDGSTVFVQNGGKIVREYLFTEGEQAYTSTAISTLSEHLIKSPVELNLLTASLDRSENYIFSLNSDHTISVFNSNRAEKRAGWVEFTSQAAFISTTTIGNRVFAILQSFSEGATYSSGGSYFLCEFSNTVNTDISSIYSGSSGVFDVSSSFEDGVVLNVIDKNNYLGEFTVASGNIDVSSVSTLSSAEIGLKFDVNLRTNPIDLVAQNGPLTGDIRGISSVILDLNSTLSTSVNGTNLLISNVTSDFSLPLESFTGKKEFRLLGYNRDPKITISQSAPLPMQVNGLIAELIF